ncbi:MAG: condensation domain-containing protein [Saprospiraceae bacterium]
MNRDSFHDRILRLSSRQRILLLGQLQENATIKKNGFKIDDMVNLAEGKSKNANKRLVGFVTGVKEKKLDSDIKSFLKNRLPDHMIPAEIVMLETLPRLSNDKIDFESLSVLYKKRGSKKISADEATPTPIEHLLIKIWEEVLDFYPVGIHDNFFEIGGDSILSIHINGKARKMGILLAPNQIFKHQTISELALYAKSETIKSSNEAIENGDLEMLPIQHWFFEEHKIAPQHWNQAISFDLPNKLSEDIVQQAINQIIVRHDALRLSFTSIKGKWKASILKPEKINSFQYIDLSHLSIKKQNVEIKKLSTSIHTTFILSEGGLFKCFYFGCGKKQDDQILMVAHHLLVDNLSWQIIIQDITTILEQLKQGINPLLLSKSISYKNWSEHLMLLVKTQKFRDDFKFWKTQAKDLEKFPVDFEYTLPVNEASIQTAFFSLNVESTQFLLTDIHPIYQTNTNEVLITALIMAMKTWRGITRLCLGLERHGRETTEADIDFSNSVGWFTTYFPVALDLGMKDDVGEKIKSIKEQLRKIPHGGISYGVHRYLYKGSGKQKKIDHLPAVIFNFLGVQKNIYSEVLGIGRSIYSKTRDSQSERHHMLEFNVSIVDKRLEVKLSYSNQLHKFSTIKDLLSNFEKTIYTLIDHCLSKDRSVLSPSDFPDVDINQDDLDKLLDQLNS